MVRVYVPEMNVELKSVQLKRKLKSISQLLEKLEISSMFIRLPKAIDSLDLHKDLYKQSPPDGVEIVDWMLASAADNAILDAWAQEYSKASSTPQPKIAFGAGDPWAPGVRNEDLYAPSERGAVVRSRGYAIVKTPYGDRHCPAPGKSLFAEKDMLAWACVPWVATHQWRIALTKWKELAKTPIKSRVRFPSIGGYVAPNFFTVSTKIPTPVVVMRIGITSDKDQKISIRGRGTSGSYHKIIFEDSVSINSGENEIIYNLVRFPIVGTFTLELQPQDRTKTVLDYLETIPP